MKTRMGIALLAMGGVILALYLSLYKLGVIGELTCSVGSCETVQLSEWATFLGVPVAVWGVGAYLAVLALALTGLQPAFVESRMISWLLVGLNTWNVLFSAWLTYLELYVIDAICMWCVVSAMLMAVILVLSLLDLRATRGPRAAPAT
ncbi:MAG TPA: vitamin K epoxide reductase family protein [Gemmatimonadaceae bacterium]|nr:vitamin K epoxide reductase family protein [Gemmatimonadaceae bacterium]